MYRDSVKIRYPDCDHQGQLKLSAAMRCMEQVSSDHLEHIGTPTLTLFDEHKVFLLMKTNIVVHRMPASNERVEILTAPTATRGVRFVREYAFDAPDGERLLSAYTLWVLADTQTHRPLRPKSFGRPLPLEESILDGTVRDEPLPEGGEVLERHEQVREVRYSHLDVNAHVNNCIYADFVLDALPFAALQHAPLAALSLQFEGEARQGDRIHIAAERLAAASWRVRGHVEGRPCFSAHARFRLEAEK